MELASLEELKDPADAALMARIQRYFHGAIQSLPNSDKARALSAPDDFWTLLETLALTPIEESPELKVRLRGALARRELLESDGGVLNPSSVAELLGISRQAVGLRRATNKLLAIEANRGFVYPAWQFEGADVLPGLIEVLKILGDDDPWSNFIFLLGHDDALAGKRPIDLLRTGNLEDVKRAARTYSHHGSV